jgi:hypothetical protein
MGRSPVRDRRRITGGEQDDLAGNRSTLRQSNKLELRELTITEMISDSIVIAVMAADGVDPVVLEAQLRDLAKGAAAARCAGP